MIRCAVKPYEGEEGYIFVSYSHRDKTSVFPIIERLVADGYRVWYDEGIDPGSEWPETIAEHLNKCAVCIAFISGESLASHYCRREINFALSKQKHFLSIMLEKVELSPGMEMQLSANQSIFKYTFDSDRAFYGKVYDAKFMRLCKRMPETASDARSVGQDGTPAGLMPEKSEARAVARLVRTKTGERFDLSEGETKLGRSNTTCDYAILGNSAVGRCHALVRVTGRECRLVDCRSTNKTYLNGQPIEPETEYLLHDGDSVRLANEPFTFYLLAE